VRVGARVTSSGTDIAADLRALSGRIDELPATLAARTARLGPETILATVTSRRGTTSVGELGRLEVRADSHVAGQRAEVELTSRGPWTIVDEGAKAHEITTRRRGMPTSHGIFARVDHPGTRGIHAWDDGTRELERRLDNEVPATVDATLEA
jgi:hypothetical protein